MSRFIEGIGIGEDPFIALDEIVAVEHTKIDIDDSGSISEVVFVYLRTGHKFPIYVGNNHMMASRAREAVRNLLDDNPIYLFDLLDKMTGLSPIITSKL